MSPLRNILLLTIPLHNVIAASVIGLFLKSRPSNIARLIVAIIVWIAIQGMLRRWTRTHIRQEVLERFLPSSTNDNAVLSVSPVRPTSPDHVVITTVSAGATHPMFRRLFGDDFPMQTSAGFAVFIGKSPFLNGFFSTTLATTKPVLMINLLD